MTELERACRRVAIMPTGGPNRNVMAAAEAEQQLQEEYPDYDINGMLHRLLFGSRYKELLRKRGRPSPGREAPS